MIKTMYDLMEPNNEYMLIFTNLDSGDVTIKKKNLSLSEIGSTCCWKIAAYRQADKVLLYIRENNINTVYIGDYDRKTRVPEDGNRFKIYFKNLKLKDITKSNWKEFTDSNAQSPVRFIKGK